MEIVADLEKISENYKCQKCRNTSAIVKKVHLPESSLKSLLPIGSGRYVFLICSLCGYTEIYDSAVYVKSQQEAKDKTGLSETEGPVS